MKAQCGSCKLQSDSGVLLPLPITAQVSGDPDLPTIAAGACPACGKPAYSMTKDAFKAMLNAASAVTLDDGRYILEWETDDWTGESTNQVVAFRWTDDDLVYSINLTEEGISCGDYDENGTFTLQDDEGDPITLRFFRFEQMACLGSGATQSTISARDKLQRLVDDIEQLSDAEGVNVTDVLDRLQLHLPDLKELIEKSN